MADRDFHENEASLYFKDDWKVKKNLTLNLGLRWDYIGVPYESTRIDGGALRRSLGNLGHFGIRIQPIG